MKIWKQIIRLLATSSLVAYLVTGEEAAAISLLVFSSLTIGIMLGEISKKKELSK